MDHAVFISGKLSSCPVLFHPPVMNDFSFLYPFHPYSGVWCFSQGESVYSSLLQITFWGCCTYYLTSLVHLTLVAFPLNTVLKSPAVLLSTSPKKIHLLFHIAVVMLSSFWYTTAPFCTQILNIFSSHVPVLVCLPSSSGYSLSVSTSCSSQNYCLLVFSSSPSFVLFYFIYLFFCHFSAPSFSTFNQRFLLSISTFVFYFLLSTSSCPTALRSPYSFIASLPLSLSFRIFLFHLVPLLRYVLHYCKWRSNCLATFTLHQTSE